MSATVIACVVVGLPAHEVSRSESSIAVEDGTVRVRFGINLLELDGVDADADQRVSYEELDASIDWVFAAIKQHFLLRAPGAPARVVLERHDIVEDHMLTADLTYTFDGAVRRLDVVSTLDEATTPAHVHHVRADLGGEPAQALLTPANRTVSFAAGGVTIGRIVAFLGGLLGVGALLAWRVVQRRSSRKA